MDLNADIFLDKWSKAQERAIDAERALIEAWYIMDTIEGNDAVDEWQNKYSKYIESDYISCPECDALASHGANDGPCEAHKTDKVKCNSIHPEEINCEWKEFKILSGNINLCEK